MPGLLSAEMGRGGTNPTVFVKVANKGVTDTELGRMREELKEGIGPLLG